MYFHSNKNYWDHQSNSNVCVIVFVGGGGLFITILRYYGTLREIDKSLCDRMYFDVSGRRIFPRIQMH